MLHWCNLSELVVSNIDWSRSAEAAPVTLGRLDNLTYKDYYRTPASTCPSSEFFSRVTAPVLKHLTISRLYNNKSESSRPLDVIAEFMTRSSCSLSSFSISRTPITDFECLSLLRLFPDLRELEIKEPASLGAFFSDIITDEFLNGLHTTCLTSSLFQDKSNLPCIPKLQHLSLCVNRSRPAPFTPETLIDMVRSRWIPDAAYSSEVGIACLRSIKLIGDRRAAEETPGSGYKSLRGLEKSGLRVEIL
ncbi:hypothetical protein K435DRAFT_786050 [Dendrothele bispora CBS 962.96]|uniref:F-box domain-containing protein n=1 Tax=Dendrothele bispora (strain CBS 962.96) TaxID=1314807 RepID=A0A4S8KST5_DENBC|nr:hypothetical protein K435DRAFT_786050 [Dendrothele bispora CBS 962.96]